MRDSPWSLSQKFQQVDQLWRNKWFPAQHTGTSENCTLKHLKVDKQEQPWEVRREESSYGHGGNPSAQSLWWAWQGKERRLAIADTSFRQLGGAESLSVYYCKSEGCELPEPVKRPGQGHSKGVLPQLMSIKWSVSQKKKWSHRALTSFRLPKLSSCGPWYRVSEHIISKSENFYVKIAISLCDWSPAVGCGKGPWGGLRCPLLRGQKETRLHCGYMG